jgi:CHAT domain/Tetratricopeptide repeat
VSDEEILQRVQRRIGDYQRSRRADIVLCREAEEDVAALTQAARATSQDGSAQSDYERLSIYYALGLLHYFRYLSLPSGPADDIELAQTIVFLSPLAGNPTVIPRALRAVLGPAADNELQVNMAIGFTMKDGPATNGLLLDAAIILADGAVRAAAPEHPRRARYFGVLGQAYRLRYDRRGNLTDLDDAIGYCQRALAAAAGPDPELPGILFDLCVAGRKRYQHRQDPADLNLAIEAGERAVAAVRGYPQKRAGFQNSLSLAYRDRYRHSGDAADLDQAVALGEQAVADTPVGALDRPGILSNLGVGYRRRYDSYGDLADLDRAIEIGEEVDGMVPRDQGSRAMNLSSLGLAYQDRYERGGSLADLERAIEVGEQAPAAVPPGDPGRPVYLFNLVDALLNRYRRRGDTADVRHAIEVAAEAVATTPDDHHDRGAMLGVLGAAYLERYRSSGAPEDLDRAAELIQGSVASDVREGPDRARGLSALCVVYLDRYERQGILADLQRAIEAGERAVAASPGYHPDRAIRLSGLVHAYRARYERAGKVDDLRRAIELYEQALASVTDGHFHRAAMLSTLGGLYMVLYERGGSLADLERAAEFADQAVTSVSAGHPDRGKMLSNRASITALRYERLGAAADLERAIELGEQAVTAMPPDHSGSASVLSNLVHGYQLRFDAGGTGPDAAALAALARQTAAATKNASPADRVRCARMVGALALAVDAPAVAVSLLDAAVGLLPSVAPRAGEWGDQEYRLGAQSGLVEVAIAAHCAAGDPAGAVEIAELGRGVMLASQMNARTDLSDLEQAEPELAARFRQVRDQLALADSTGGVWQADAARLIDQRNQLWAQHDQLLDQIRQNRRFTRFLLPPRLAELRAAAGGSGTVVLVNAALQRSDAIIITADHDPVAVPLPDLTIDDVLGRAVGLLEATQFAAGLAGRLRRRRVLAEVLAWLWEAAVGPVLDALPSIPGGENPPRVWWMPTGPLGLFPLHAAGPPGHPGALAAVTSSYTPTLRALARTRGRAPATVRRQLTVELRHTPGLPDLPGTTAEAEDLYRRYPGTPPLRDQDATTASVLAALPDATWTHFACHASADLSAPSRSGLHLHDGILSVPDISRLDLVRAELAYLSACSTANQGVGAVDESIHLASAFQLAGFRHVIASLWPLEDLIAATAAQSFYHRMDAAATTNEAAATLRQVTLDLRAAHPDRPDLWASLIHSGA